MKKQYYSTKIELDSGEGFEIYQEVFDPDSVYLRLHNLPGEGELECPTFHVETNPLGVDLRVRIPLWVLDVLRSVEPQNLEKFKTIESSPDENSD